MSALRWVRDVVGGFAAGFVAYVVAGSYVGLGVAAGLRGSGSICPTAFYGAVGVRCEDPLVRTFWYAIADLPSLALTYPLAVVMALVGPTNSGSYLVIEETNVLVGAGVVVTLCVLGLLAWRHWSPRIASTLGILLVGDLVFAVFWAAWGLASRG